MDTPLVDNHYLLQKFPGKGGWTYAEIPEVLQDKSAPFGWVQVRGSIDGFQIKQYKLMPMGNGRLFLPVKADIRKIIGKGEGQTVHVVLYADHSAIEIPDDLLACLLDAPQAMARFQNMPDSHKKAYIDWIESAKKVDTKVNRIARAIEMLEKGEVLKR